MDRLDADSNIFVGSYTGDGNATQAITGVGFAGAFPELLAIYHLLGDPALQLK